MKGEERNFEGRRWFKYFQVSLDLQLWKDARDQNENDVPPPQEQL
jgi:hypothetical protein